MRSKDLVPLIITAVVSALIGWVISGMAIDKPPLTRQINTMVKISGEFLQPDKDFFNEDSIDTFVPTSIGDPGPDN